MPIRKTQEEFISDAKKVHGDKYDYSKVNYINNRTKVLIGCVIHGDFEQTPRNHLSGCGCIECGYTTMRTKTTMAQDEFINRAKETHNIEYDYSKVNYQGSETQVIIICPKHGEFLMSPHQFLRGSNCPSCSLRAQLSAKTFIEKSKKIHGDKYDYSKVEYVNNQTKVCIICPEHGKFYQRPSSHLKGNGCIKCRGKKIQAALGHMSTSEFIERSNKIHHNKYDYSQTIYEDYDKEVNIICPEHGVFRQKPGKHLHKHGCPMCGNKYNITEIQVLGILKKHFTNVEYQKTFDFLHDGCGIMKLDYFLPDYNFAIELQGVQHFKPVSIFGGEKEFIKNKMRDDKKFNLCKKNRIKVFYLSFVKHLPTLYIDKIYTNIEELITEIKSSNKND